MRCFIDPFLHNRATSLFFRPLRWMIETEQGLQVGKATSWKCITISTALQYRITLSSIPPYLISHLCFILPDQNSSLVSDPVCLPISLQRPDYRYPFPLSSPYAEMTHTQNG